jgi:putative transposase
MSLSLVIDQPYHTAMKRVQAFKFELRPDGAQRRQMRCFAGSCRFVYNKALTLQKARFDAGEKKLNYAGLCKLLTGWRSQIETLWLKDAPTHPLQQALKDSERAYSNFFARRADLPRFKKKGRHDSFRYPDPQQIKLDQANSRLFLPKLGWLRYRNSRKVLGTVKNATVSLSCGKWFVSIQTEREVEPSLPRGGAVGIDLGVVRFATLSDGTFYAPLNSFRRHQSRLRKAQLILVPQRNTSRRCPQCDAVSAENRRTQERFACIACGFEANADLVGAINILRAGHARCACEVSDADRQQQEPAEAIQEQLRAA